MFLVLALDILVSLLWPVRHVLVKTSGYVFILSLPAISYSIVYTGFATLHVIRDKSNPTILLCNPPQVVEQNLSKIWINWNGFSNVGVLLVYLAIYIIIRRREKRLHIHIVQNNSQRKAFHSLLWLILVFASTWCTLMITLVVVSWMEPSLEVTVIQGYMVVFALMAYSANYYVYFAKNLMYRRIFLQQLKCLLPKRFATCSSCATTAHPVTPSVPISTLMKKP
ncbi:unnamed protein product [Heligmosomoides polygyrus]|uniref:G_PROTEIN_RECEP_F1_2 domain-containing protein n=1 Tax=Heligmosomoides polygyrus TaxID=6339 RepID=A0A183FF79_HELPZ|nr:unnamed protein product [Heligmosomoides polygyrus]